MYRALFVGIQGSFCGYAGLFLWVYRALLVNATICSNRDSTYRALLVDVQGSFGEYKDTR